MKKLFLIVIAFLSVSFFSCNPSSKKHNLSARLAKGDTFNLSSNSKMNFSVEVMGSKQEFKTENTSEMRYEVLDSSVDGSEIKMTIIKTKNQMDLGKQFSDSTVEKASEEFAGKSIFFRVKDRAVLDVRGFDSIKPSGDSVATQMMKWIKPEETFSQMTEMLFDIYPGEPVSVGDRWSKNSELSYAGVPIKLSTKYALKEVKDDLAYITVNGKILSDDIEIPMMPGLKIKLDGKYKGETSLRLNSGYPNRSNYEFEVKTEPEMMGQKVPILIKGTVMVTGK